MQNYFLDDNSNFVINNYQNGKPFTSFLPGIAGPFGIPLWVFYVNRGQAISSFGHKSKDFPILEFQPANRAYQTTPATGFRTFIRIKGEKKIDYYEPFSRQNNSQEMIIGANELTIKETSAKFSLAIEVVYFLLPGENLSGLVRMVRITNLSSKFKDIEILDGLPSIIPFGVNNQMLKEMGRTVEAWMEVYNVNNNIPFYKLRASVADTIEVSNVVAGNYMLSYQEEASSSTILPIIVDPNLIFGQNTSFSEPEGFYISDLTGILSANQITCSRTPCGFAGLQSKLKSGESARFFSITGHTERLENVCNEINRISATGFINEKRSEANRITKELTDSMFCSTSSPEFNAYCRQTYLDNVLRGGVPMVFGEGEEKKVFYIYSRKHGDPERDYNAFDLSPEFLSQGNGNYRDVNQNRREDVWFNPGISDFDIKTFMSLVQLDGFNPLVLKGTHFVIAPDKLKSLSDITDKPDKLMDLLSTPFTPGHLLQQLKEEAIQINIDPWKFIERVLGLSEQKIEAEFGEGYWVDHWTYNLDLIDSYLSIFPDKVSDAFFTKSYLPWYDNPYVVLPRSEKFVLIDGKPRQMGRPVEDMLKTKQITGRIENANWVRKNLGKGEILYSTLFEKLFSLVLVKFSSMDPGGMGIEMEAGRPGWYDAVNGLPGLFGSSVAESYTLLRAIHLLQRVLADSDSDSIRLPIEISGLLQKVNAALTGFYLQSTIHRDFQYWDRISSAREDYRASIQLGVDGTEKTIANTEVVSTLNEFEKKVKGGVVRAEEIQGGFPPTFLMYSVDKFELRKDSDGAPIKDQFGNPYFLPKSFSAQPMPLFLEGMVRAMRISDYSTAERLYYSVKNSPLYDRPLGMYKVNASIESLPMDIGRARAFTPGWLENESIWLHMEYKYMLELLHARLYKQFFDDFKSVFIPFLDPERYGRSTLENSSFLVSSVHPDITLHGTGFVSRLSGATAEFLSVWKTMMAGERIFYVENDQLQLQFSPILPSWLFDKLGTISFKFLGGCMVTYYNPRRVDTFDSQAVIKKLKLYIDENTPIDLSTNIIPSPYSQMVRDGTVKRIDAYYS